MIDAAISAKADCIKFQTYTASKLVTKSAPKYWDDGVINETQYDVFKKLDTLTNDQWKIIFDYANTKNIVCFSTPFDESSVDFLYDLNVPAFKIASADITHMPLIKKVAKKHLPIFISTGMASENEVDDALGWIKDEGNNDIIIMHCITSYPTTPEDANLEMIKTLKQKYPQHIIGYSDHTIGTVIPTYSVLYGAKCIEKHFTFDTKLSTSRDHRLSLDQKGFLEMVNNIRLAEISKGHSTRNHFDAEVDAVKYARRSIVSTSFIPKGTILRKEMLAIKRPGTGLAPKLIDKIIGLRTIVDIPDDTPITKEQLSE